METTNPEPSGSSAGRLAGEAARVRVAALFEERGTLVRRICRRLLRDEFEAEDAAQQAFLSAYRALLGGAEPRDVDAWLVTIARNECVQRIRGRMRQPLPAFDADADDRRADVHQLVVDRVNARRLWREINRLPQQQRDAVVLREVVGLSYEELGALLGLTRSSVESLLFRARGQLRSRLRAALASLNVVGIVSEAGAALARLAGSSAAPLAAKAAAVGVGVAVVGGGGVVAERKLVPGIAVAAPHATARLPAQASRAGHRLRAPVLTPVIRFAATRAPAVASRHGVDDGVAEHHPDDGAATAEPHDTAGGNERERGDGARAAPSSAPAQTAERDDGERTATVPLVTTAAAAPTAGDRTELGGHDGAAATGTSGERRDGGDGDGGTTTTAGPVTSTTTTTTTAASTTAEPLATTTAPVTTTTTGGDGGRDGSGSGDGGAPG